MPMEVMMTISVVNKPISCTPEDIGLLELFAAEECECAECANIRCACDMCSTTVQDWVSLLENPPGTREHCGQELDIECGGCPECIQYADFLTMTEERNTILHELGRS